MWNSTLLRARRTQIAQSQMSAQVGQLRELQHGLIVSLYEDRGENNTHEPDTGTSPEEQLVGPEGACDVRRICGVCWTVYWIRKEKACG